FEKVSRQDIYQTTGIQFLQINTLFQLFATQRDRPELLHAARTLLTIPDLFHYWLTGNAVCEFTNATTTQMVDAVNRSWARELMERVGLPPDIAAQIVEPGTVIGTVVREVAPMAAQRGTPVIAPASHDTGSAFAAVSARGNTAFISSGTWSLVGTELTAPIMTDTALRMNFTNEGGVCGTTRFLKNVMGLWMLQGCRSAWAPGKGFTYDELVRRAAEAPAFGHIVDPDDPSFLNPADMTAAITRFR